MMCDRCGEETIKFRELFLPDDDNELTERWLMCPKCADKTIKEYSKEYIEVPDDDDTEF